MNAHLIQVIETSLETRGAGVAGDPIRRITQYYSPDGTLLAEKDPCAGNTADNLALKKRVETLENAILWALGLGDGTFGSTMTNQSKPFWWRKELRQRAQIETGDQK